MNWDKVLDIDRYLLLSLNGSDSLFWDGCMQVYTSMLVWMPLALVLVYLLLKNNGVKDFFVLLLMVTLVVLGTDQISSGLCKPFFQRWRPTNDPVIMYAVDVVNGIREGRYGFTSSHAANSFGLATFFSLLVRNRAFTLSMILWAGMNAFTRIYLGVHYPGDILGGTLIGVTVGWAVYKLYSYIQKRQNNRMRRNWISTNYTKGGYLVSDVYLFLMFLYLTFAAIPVISFFVFKV